MLKYWILIIISAAPSISYGEDFLKYGTGMFSGAQSSPLETPIIMVGVREHLGPNWSPFIYQLGAGFWLDRTAPTGNGRSSSGFGEAALGFEVETQAGIVARSVHGVAFITSPDCYLGGAFPQFYNEFFLGVRSKEAHATFGASYIHISSAGIYQPNMGRDFLTIDLGWAP